MRKITGYMVLARCSPNRGKILDVIQKGIEFLKDFPFTCRKATAEDPLLREMIISFGTKGYVILFEIEDNETVTILAVRHQREDDYY